MTVSSSHLWKSAAASARPASRTADKNMHIGQTLRDLYVSGHVPSREDRFQRLLDELDSVEADTERS